MGRLKRTVALVGMMGAGKSSLGRRLAAKLDVPFRDADAEVEAAAGCTINEIFERYGEAAFRDCERKVTRRDTRPLLRNGNAREILSDLLAARENIYSQADVTVMSEDGPPAAGVSR